MIHLSLLADAALLLVLLRMIWVGADRACPREFFFLLSLLCYALLSFAPSFPAWGHAGLAFFALPMLFDVSKTFPARYARPIAALAVSAAAMLYGPASLARWGNSAAARWALLGALLELAAGTVLVMSAFQHFKNSAISRLPIGGQARLRLGIGVHFLLVNAAALLGVAFPATVFAATLVWLITAAALAPTPDVIIATERLAFSRSVVAQASRAAGPARTPEQPGVAALPGRIGEHRG